MQNGGIYIMPHAVAGNGDIYRIDESVGINSPYYQQIYRQQNDGSYVKDGNYGKTVTLNGVINANQWSKLQTGK